MQLITLAFSFVYVLLTLVGVHFMSFQNVFATIFFVILFVFFIFMLRVMGAGLVVLGRELDKAREGMKTKL